jgi:hypothetical protein
MKDLRDAVTPRSFVASAAAPAIAAATIATTAMNAIRKPGEPSPTGR